MGLFSFFNRNNDIGEEELPWYNLPSILAHIDSNLSSEGKLTEVGIKLPDEERRYEDEAFRWVAGGMDGAFGHHGGGSVEKVARKVADLVKSISIKNSQSKKLELYNILLKDNLTDFTDSALEKLVVSNVSIEPFLHAFAKWLAFESPDRGPVKFGIALLGLIRNNEDMEKITMLGKHEEFTLFSVVALTNTYENPEQKLWELARYVDGWGKIHIVERLGETQNPEIKRWLIREGYKNSIMHEYLAYTCAVGGGLKSELSKNQVDDELLGASGDIIEALINGGPAEDIDVYSDGAEVVRLYVAHMRGKSVQTLRDFLVLHAIKRFLEDEDADWKERKEKGWTEDLKADLLIDIHKMISDPKWEQIVLEKQNSKDNYEFWQVNQAAGFLGIDMWETHWNRLTENPTEAGLWYDVMKSANDERIDQIVSLASSELPLDKLATGPEDVLGLGPEYSLHSCLDYLLQDLNKFPNKGFELIKSGLRSPVTRNRNMALKALSSWDVANWPTGTREILEKATKEEPNKETKKDLRNLLDGKEIE